MTAYADWSVEATRQIIDRYRDVPGGLLPLLHEIQATFGYVDKRCEALIADGLNISRADVHGVITFYHDFRHKRPGRHVIHVCRAEACQAVGCRDLEAHAKRRLSVDYGETTDDGGFTLLETFCLGNCAVGPSVMIDGDLYGRVTPRRMDDLLAERGWEAV